MPLICPVSAAGSVSSLEKTTFPLFSQVRTSENPSDSKPSFSSAIGTLFFPLMFTPRSRAIYCRIYFPSHSRRRLSSTNGLFAAIRPSVGQLSICPQSAQVSRLFSLTQ